jgi:hypothetical protein
MSTLLGISVTARTDIASSSQRRMPAASHEHDSEKAITT